MNILKFSYSLMSNKFKLYLYICLTLFSVIIGILVPIFMGDMLDILVYKKVLSDIYILCGIFGVLNIIKVILNYITNMLYADIFVCSSYKISSYVIEHIHNCSVKKTDGLDPAYYNQRISQDAGAIVTFFLSTIVGVLNSIIELVVSLVVICSISSKYATYNFILLFIYFITYKLLKTRLYEKGKINTEKQSLYFSKMYEQLQNTKFIKLHGMKEFFSERLKTTFFDFKDSFIKYQRIVNLFNLLNSSFIIGTQIFMYLICGLGVIKGTITIGEFAIINSYFSTMTGTASFFFSLGNSYQNALISFDRISEILRWEEEKDGTTLLGKINKISIEHLSFSHDNMHILQDINMEFEVGKIYAIVGKNGSGKSTLMHLILGLYQDSIDGKIKINGIEINQINMEHLRKYKIGYAEQEPILFTDTIKRNTILWKSEKWLKESIIQRLGILDFIERLPEKWGSLINPKANNFSGGEKQRITLSRMFINENDLLIFDEPTSALDHETIKILLDYLDVLKQNRIIIVITHDKNVADFCDEIITIPNGIAV